MAQVVEHILGKDEVTSSNLVSSSRSPGADAPGFLIMSVFGADAFLLRPAPFFE